MITLRNYHFCFVEEIAMIPNDPVMLLSYVNLKLRDEFSSLDEMCDKLDVDKQEIISKLASINYRYNSEQNQFK